MLDIPENTRKGLRDMHARYAIGPDVILHDERPRFTFPSCMFCFMRLDGWGTIEDPSAFSLHIAQSDECRREYQLYNQALRDEWPSD